MIPRITEAWRRASRTTRGIVAVGATTALLIAALSASLFATGAAFRTVAPDLPDHGVDVAAIDDLNDAVLRSASRASRIVDVHGDVIGRFAPEETYLPLDVGEVPLVVEAPLLAAEDESFREHTGFELRAMARALLRNAASGEIEQGGSTLTQQLAKNLFTGDDNSLERKLEEIQVAIELEERFSKEEILTAYVNSVFLGNGAFGFEAAARTYFGKPAKHLTLSESSMLVGMLPAPTARDPRSNFEAANRARLSVLDRVEEAGNARQTDIDAAREQVPEVLDRRPTRERFPYYQDYVRRYLLDTVEIDPELLYGGGLTIETALVPALQTAARTAVSEHLPAGGPEAAVTIVDVRTGLVPTIVGGRSFDDAQVNLALGREGGGSGRQAGSSFKPFVLAAAFEDGIVPDQHLDAPREYLPETVDDPQPVRNFNDRGYGQVTLEEATVRSINTAFVNLTEAVGAGAVRDTAAALGVSGLPEHVGPSIGIGAYETSTLDMAGAYASFADDGRRVEVGPVTRILDPEGEVIVDHRPVGRDGREQAVSTTTARWINDTLDENVQRGTATRAQIGRPAAAKTGTSDDYANAWLAGHTPHFAAAVWVGHPEGNIPMHDVAGFADVTGGSIPALIWRDVMTAAHAGVAPVDFPAPPPTPEPSRLLPGATTTTTTTSTTAPPTTAPPTTPATTTTRRTTSTTTTTTTTTSTTTTSPTTVPTTTTEPPPESTTTTTTTTEPPPESTTTMAD